VTVAKRATATVNKHLAALQDFYVWRGLGQPQGVKRHQASGRARVSYSHAEDLFKVASGGATLHQLRHSALTHDAEDGRGAPMLQARSGHASPRSLEPYVRVSAEAVQRHQAERDPARRR
jgi:integrase